MTQTELERLAALAGLELEPSESGALEEDLRRILAWVETIREQGSGLPELRELPVTLRLRPDEPHASLEVEELASRAPELERGMFIVPRVIEES